ncbi:MAG: DinB family protein [Flavipsychrobacter sp.]|nr:DinB family protein [Flavipsychrobacter sp.]
MPITPPPAQSDFGFYNRYIFKVKHLDLINAFKENWTEVNNLFSNIPEDKLLYRYDTGKWNIKEIAQHLMDGERNFCYRAMRISRKDAIEVPVYDPHAFVSNSNATERDIKNLLDELQATRNATIAFFEGMSTEMLDNEGPARDAIVSARAMGFAIVGHAIHHMEIIKERYLAVQAVA